ncbi:MAG: hypothetical protein NTW50_02550, partial [Candidatus Berkelbacteria bacterium]|nr:hypothetical protein [Candidatus Berkelbacteria bacterium]
MYDHDLAVHQKSSLILKDPKLKSRYPRVHTVVTNDWHGWDPGAREKMPIFTPPTYYSDSETLQKKVLPYIGKEALPSGGSSGTWSILPADLQNKRALAGLPISITQQELHEYAPQVNIHLGDGILAPQQTRQFELNISQPEGMSLGLLTGNKDIQLQLIEPDGQIVTKDTAGIQYQEFTLEGSTLKAYQIDSLSSGKWVVIVDGTTISKESSFLAFATPTTPVALQPILPEWRPNRNSVEITAKIASENVQVPGMHQDGKVNDGLYGNLFSQTDLGGVYRVFFSASGMFKSQAFVRNAVSFFIIAPETANLNDQFSDSMVDQNNDGAYEFLEIRDPLTVKQSGNYVISADLYAGDTYIASAVSHQSFQSGSQIAIWNFEGKLIYELQKDGPYTVRNIFLLDETELPLLIQEKPAYTTTEYSYKDFDPQAPSLITSFSLNTLFLAGGLGLLCLTVIAIGSVFVFSRTRKPKTISLKPEQPPQLSKPISSSTEQIKQAIQLAKSQHLQEALDILRRIAQSEPNNASAWFNLGG